MSAKAVEDVSLPSDTPPKALSWPAHFPKGCPGENVGEVSGDVFRIIKKATGPIEKDWTSHAERCPDGCNFCQATPPCQRAALSVRITLDAAVAAFNEINKFNRRFEGIAKATLRADHGKISQTTEDKTHYSLWLRAAALQRASSLFTVIPHGGVK